MRRRFLHEGCLEPGKPSGLSRGTPKPSSEHADGKILLLCPKPVNAHFWCKLGFSDANLFRSVNQPFQRCLESEERKNPSISAIGDAANLRRTYELLQRCTGGVYGALGGGSCSVYGPPCRSTIHSQLRIRFL